LSESGATVQPDDLATAVLSNFLERLDARVKAARAGGEGVAVLVIDCGLVDRADAVWGFGVGNAIRSHIAANLREGVLRSEDFLASVGRDDLACVLSPVHGIDMALLAAEKVMRAAGALLWAADDEVYAQPTIGVALFPEHGDQAELLLQYAKGASRFARDLPGRIALHDAARAARDTVRFLDRHRLRTAIADEKLELLFQPQVELRSDRVMGIEAFLAMPDVPEVMRAIPAARMYATADFAGAVETLTGSLLNRALRNCSEFRYAAGLDLRIAVNLSARVLLWPMVPDLVERALRTWSLRPSRLVLEISDVAVLRDHAAAREVLDRLKALGVMLAIDDVALGVEALLGLALLPFRELKLDLSEAPDLGAVPQHEHVVRAMIDLAHKLRFEVCATGVADPALAECLKALNCDYAQGLFKGPAVPAEHFVERYGFDFG